MPIVRNIDVTMHSEVSFDDALAIYTEAFGNRAAA